MRMCAHVRERHLASWLVELSTQKYVRAPQPTVPHSHASTHPVGWAQALVRALVEHTPARVQCAASSVSNSFGFRCCCCCCCCRCRCRCCSKPSVPPDRMHARTWGGPPRARGRTCGDTMAGRELKRVVRAGATTHSLCARQAPAHQPAGSTHLKNSLKRTKQWRAWLRLGNRGS